LTRVFFYHGAGDRLAAAASLISKAFAQRKRVLVYTPDADVAAALDRQLWVYPPESFVPHVRADSSLASETPIVIAERLDSIPQDERLFNLSDEVPPGFARFANLIELVGAHEQQRAAGRRRARTYLDRGYEVSYFDLSGKA